jgi:hypothetical protein
MAAALALAGGWATAAPAPASPASFLPHGLVGVQIGTKVLDAERAGALTKIKCDPATLSVPRSKVTVDEICQYKAAAGTRLADDAVGSVNLFLHEKTVELVSVTIARTGPADDLQERLMAAFKPTLPPPMQGKNELMYLKLPAQGVPPNEREAFFDASAALLLMPDRSAHNLTVTYGYTPLVITVSEMSKP